MKTKTTKYYHENSDVVAFKRVENSNGFSYECTYNEQGNELTYKDSDGNSYERTCDEQGNELTYKDSNGFSYEYTYDEQGNELTYKTSNSYYYGDTYDKKGNVLTFKNSDGDFEIKGERVTKEEYDNFIKKDMDEVLKVKEILKKASVPVNIQGRYCTVIDSSDFERVAMEIVVKLSKRK